MHDSPRVMPGNSDLLDTQFTTFGLQVFDKTVRALENAVNRLPGMHELGLENLLLEESPPPAPSTPTPGGADGTPGAAAPAVASASPTVMRPGKTSFPWAHDAVGPLSELARQVCAFHVGKVVIYTHISTDVPKDLLEP